MGDPARRVAWIGRLNLWTVTAALLCLAAAAVVGAAWLAAAAPPGSPLDTAHRGTLAAAFATSAAALFQLFVVQRLLVPPRRAERRPLAEARVHVGLTAWDDEASIGAAVREFRACPEVAHVVVADNGSADGTREAARAAGADVVVEDVRGYGACCRRALDAAAEGADVVVLCEGDGTFVAGDVRKLLAYLEDCDLVLGTRATQELRDPDTQMDWLVNPANQIVAKLVQTRFWGTRLTDVGCTYRAIRADALRRLRPRLRVDGNHFSPHMYMEALAAGLRVIEVPVGFRRRVGVSKGVGTSRVRAARTALAMLGNLYRM